MWATTNLAFGEWPHDHHAARSIAEQSGVSKPTIGRLESIDSDGPIGGRPETGEALVAALEKAGVEFIPENGGGAGVRLKKRPAKVKRFTVQSAGPDLRCIQ